MYGAEQVLLNIIPAMGASCFVSLLTLEIDTPESNSLSSLLAVYGVKRYKFIPTGRFDQATIKKIKKLIELENFDVIHSHDYKSLFYINKISKLLNIPVIHHVHGALGNTFQEKIYGVIEGWLMRGVSKIITVSNEQKHNLENGCYCYPPILQVNNGTVIKDLQVNKTSTDCLRIVMVARLTEEKNHLMAINLIEVLKSKGINVSLTLLGDGPLKETLKHEVSSRSISEHINFVGFTRDVNTWLDSSDVLLITSKTEGMPMNMLEAMERALPIISSPVGEIPRLILESGCGRVFNGMDELTEIMISLSEDRESCEIYGESGRTYIEEKLSINMQCQNSLSISESTLGHSYG
jgi:glycosyltransferase involved in cell wall biosynthesis